MNVIYIHKKKGERSKSIDPGDGITKERISEKSIEESDDSNEKKSQISISSKNKSPNPRAKKYSKSNIFVAGLHKNVESFKHFKDQSILKINELSNLETNTITPREIETSRSFINNGGFPICMICSRIYPVTEVVSTMNCSHIFCRGCISKYFHNKLEGEKTIIALKCPIVQCECMFSPYVVFENTTPGIINESPRKTFGKNIIEELKKKSKSLASKKYSLHHIIDFGSNENFFLFSKNKRETCPHCAGEFLFTKKGLDFTMCLNCQKKFCKYCKSEYTENHLDDRNSKRCTVFFRFERSNRSQLNLCQKFLFFGLLMTIAGYFILIFGVLSHTRNMIRKIFLSKKRDSKFLLCLCYIIYYFLYLIFGSIIICTVPLVFPYFPMIALIDF